MLVLSQTLAVLDFYRAMLRRSRYCNGKSSICPSVCAFVGLSLRDVEVSWSHRLEFLENNFTVS